MRNAIVIAPKSTAATKLSYDVAIKTIEQFHQSGIPTVALLGLKATRPYVERALRQHNHGMETLIIYVGHGEDAYMVGEELTTKYLYSKLRPIDLENMHLLQDAIVYSLACKTLKQLGRSTPARAYIGFNNEVKLSAYDLDQDKIADNIETFIQPIKSLLLGETVEEAVNDFKTVSNLFLEDALTNGIEDDRYIARLQQNIEGVGYHGNGYAKWADED